MFCTFQKHKWKRTKVQIGIDFYSNDWSAKVCKSIRPTFYIYVRSEWLLMIWLIHANIFTVVKRNENSPDFCEVIIDHCSHGMESWNTLNELKLKKYKIHSLSASKWCLYKVSEEAVIAICQNIMHMSFITWELWKGRWHRTDQGCN